MDGKTAHEIEPEYEAEGALKIPTTPHEMNTEEFQLWFDIGVDAQIVRDH